MMDINHATRCSCTAMAFFFAISYFGTLIGVVAVKDFDICNMDTDGPITLYPGDGLNISSPNYSKPLSYRAGVWRDGLECTMDIEAKEGGFALVSFIDAHLGGPREIPDIVEIKYTNDEVSVIQFKGVKRFPKTVTAKSPNITITFKAEMTPTPAPTAWAWSSDASVPDYRSDDDRGRGSTTGLSESADGGNTGGNTGTGSDGGSPLASQSTGNSQGGADDTDDDDGDSAYSYSYSYSFRKKRKRRDVDTGHRGFRFEIMWVPETEGLCDANDFVCNQDDAEVAVICSPGYYECDYTYTCPDQSDEFDCDTCTDDVIPENGDASPSSGPYYLGQLLFFSCKPGYELIGVTDTQCLLTRVWRDEIPTCVMPPASTIDPAIIAREKKETTMFLVIVIPSIVVCLAIAIGLLQLCSRHLAKQEEIYKAEWEEEEAARIAAEEAEATANEKSTLEENGDLADNISAIKVQMENGVPDPTDVKIPSDEKAINGI